MAFVKLLDETDEMEIIVFPVLYAEAVSLLEKQPGRV